MNGMRKVRVGSAWLLAAMVAMFVTLVSNPTPVEAQPRPHTACERIPFARFFALSVEGISRDGIDACFEGATRPTNQVFISWEDAPVLLRHLREIDARLLSGVTRSSIPSPGEVALANIGALHARCEPVESESSDAGVADVADAATEEDADTTDDADASAPEVVTTVDAGARPHRIRTHLSRAAMRSHPWNPSAWFSDRECAGGRSIEIRPAEAVTVSRVVRNDAFVADATRRLADPARDLHDMRSLATDVRTRLNGANADPIPASAYPLLADACLATVAVLPDTCFTAGSGGSTNNHVNTDCPAPAERTVYVRVENPELRDTVRTLISLLITAAALFVLLAGVTIVLWLNNRDLKRNAKHARGDGLAEGIRLGVIQGKVQAEASLEGLPRVLGSLASRILSLLPLTDPRRLTKMDVLAAGRTAVEALTDIMGAVTAARAEDATTIQDLTQRLARHEDREDPTHHAEGNGVVIPPPPNVPAGVGDPRQSIVDAFGSSTVEPDLHQPIDTGASPFPFADNTEVRSVMPPVEAINPDVVRGLVAMLCGVANEDPMLLESIPVSEQLAWAFWALANFLVQIEEARQWQVWHYAAFENLATAILETLPPDDMRPATTTTPEARYTTAAETLRTILTDRRAAQREIELPPADSTRPLPKPDSKPTAAVLADIRRELRIGKLEKELATSQAFLKGAWLNMTALWESSARAIAEADRCKNEVHHCESDLAVAKRGFRRALNSAYRSNDRERAELERARNERASALATATRLEGELATERLGRKDDFQTILDMAREDERKNLEFAQSNFAEAYHSLVDVILNGEAPDLTFDPLRVEAGRPVELTLMALVNTTA